MRPFPLHRQSSGSSMELCLFPFSQSRLRYKRSLLCKKKKILEGDFQGFSSKLTVRLRSFSDTLKHIITENIQVEPFSSLQRNNYNLKLSFLGKVIQSKPGRR